MRCHEPLDVFAGECVAECVFHGGHIEPGDVAAHDGEQPKEFPLASHVEHDLDAVLGLDGEFYAAFLNDVERVRGTFPGAEDNGVAREIFERHGGRDSAQVGNGEELEGRNVAQKRYNI